MVGAAHAAGVAIDGHGQAAGDRAAMVIEFVDGEIDPEVGAASATTLAFGQGALPEVRVGPAASTPSAPFARACGFPPRPRPPIGGHR